MQFFRRGLFLGAVVTVLAIAAPVRATGIFDCGPGGVNCGISATIDGVTVASGTYSIDPVTGAISLPAPIAVSLNGGVWTIQSLNGNADPILGFSTNASTGAAGNAFSVTFTLPIALAGTIAANSSVNYSLTGTTAPGAQITPLFGTVLIAQEVDTTVGGLLPLNKGVDTGSTFSCSPGPCNTTSPTYTASNSFVGNLAYDLMSVTIAFSLSPNSNVGLSGFVQQLAVPEPAAGLLLVVGLVALARRRAS